MKTTVLFGILLSLGACSTIRLPEDPDVLLDPPVSTEPARTVFEALIRHHGFVEMIDLGVAGEAVSVEDAAGELEAVGFSVFAFHGSDDDGPTGIRHHLDRKRPLLLLVQRGEDPRWLLVVGYDDASGLYILKDPKRGLVAIRRDRLLEMWTATEHIGILALPTTD